MKGGPTPVGPPFVMPDDRLARAVPDGGAGTDARAGAHHL